MSASQVSVEKLLQHWDYYQIMDGDGSYSDLRLLSNLEEHNQSADNSYLTQSFHEQQQIDAFIRKSKLFNVVKTEAENFVKAYQSPQRPEDRFNAIVIRVSFFYADFLNHPLDLLHFLVEEPVQFNNAVKYSVYALIREIIKEIYHSENGDNLGIDICQIHVLTRFVGLPLQQDLCFQPHTNSYRTGISEVIGILAAVTQPDKVVTQSVWYCSGCERNKIRTHLLDVPCCVNCSHPMNEYTKLRHTQNFHLLRILPCESIESPRKVNKIFRAIIVRVAEHTFECQLILGDRYSIIGHYKYFSQQQEFEAWSITSI